jgi:hypothetical protein
MKENNKSLFDQPIVAINVGLIQFSENLEQQGVEVVHIDWTPPAGGDAQMIDLLDRLL